MILYELITGRPPFPRTRESILRTLDTDPLPPSRLRPGIPDALERICQKCLRKATRDRYASTGVLVAELNRFVQVEPLIETPPHTAWQRVRDWARSEPALAARLAVIVACSAIIWGFRLIAGGTHRCCRATGPRDSPRTASSEDTSRSRRSSSG